MILDTTFFIDFLYNDSGARDKIRELELQNHSLTTTAITVFELWRGISPLNHNKIETTNTLLEQVDLHSLNPTAAKIAGRIAYQLKRKGLILPPEDALIAGIALEKNEPILTRNVKHFKLVPELKIETY